MNEKYGLLTVVERLGFRESYGRRKTFVRAKCECGKEIEVELTRLVQGHKKSCGHLRQNAALAMRLVKERKYREQAIAPGTRFSKLTVIEDLGIQDAHACFCAYTKRADAKGLAWELGENDFLYLAKQPCFYCGSLPSNVSGNAAHNGKFVYNGLDRLDSAKGYVPGNVVSCCSICNRAKSDLPLEDFMAWLEKFRRPRGDVTIERIVDRRGREIAMDEAVRREWIVVPRDPVREPYTTDTRNVFVDQGRQLIAYLFGFRAPVSDFACQKFGVGTGLTVARTTDVALEAPILFGAAITKVIDFVDYVNPYVARVIYTLGVNDANGYMISEMGLFAGNDALLARKVQAVTINKTSDASITMAWRIRF